MEANPHEGEPVENNSSIWDIPHWAQPISKLKVNNIPGGAINLNVDGRQVVSPIQGFGPVWQKTYRVRLSGIDTSPAEVIKSWKANFQAFQLGVRGRVQYFKVLIDPRFQWSHAKNVWKNAIVRSFFYQLAAPLRWVRIFPRN
jgi:hypothetical protein